MEKGTSEMDPGAVESLIRAIPSPQSRIGGIGVVDPGKINGPFIHLFRTIFVWKIYQRQLKCLI